MRHVAYRILGRFISKHLRSCFHAELGRMWVCSHQPVTPYIQYTTVLVLYNGLLAVLNHKTEESLAAAWHSHGVLTFLLSQLWALLSP